MSRPRIVLLAFTVLAACGPKAPVAPTPDDSAEPVPEAKSMKSHFARYLDLQSAVVDGDLGTARTVADTFTKELGHAEHPVEWSPYLREVRAELTAIAVGQSIEDTAGRTAMIGAVCGRCHRELGGGLVGRAVAPLLKVASKDIADHMRIHSEAAQSMALGLVAPSDEAWKQGAEALAAAGLFPEGAGHEPDMVTMRKRLDALSAKARTTVEWPARAQLYGEYLATCAKCHRYEGD